ncbi:MAG: hypothetical protein P9M15_04500 [Candidatus Electryoneaceae bacterium]|nr:hypothetical protein [Candidatus Electryoneaceae bacterium]
MLWRQCLIITLFLSFSLMIIGCGDEDYRNGMYWLNKKDNWQQASRAFQRSLDKNPNRWKTHKMLIEALGKGDDDLAMETQLKETLDIFPDSTRAASMYGPGVSVLGEERYNRIASGIEQLNMSRLLAQNGKDPGILSRSIMAACRQKDKTAVIDYYMRLLTVLDGQDASDSVIQEMNFFIGPARTAWIKYDWQIGNNPDDTDAYIRQLDLGLVMGDPDVVRQKLRELVISNPEILNDPSVAKRFGLIAGFDPFGTKELITGWDGSYSPDGKYLIYIKEMGRPNSPDPYIYRVTAAGGGQTPLLKAVQQSLSSIAMPRYSPNGKWIYFYGSSNRDWSPGQPGRFNLYRVKPIYGNRPQKLTTSDILPVPIFFESDGSILLVRKDVGSLRSSVRVIRLNPDTKQSTITSRVGEPVIGATFNPAGDSLLFTTDRGLFRRSIDGGAISVDLTWRNMRFPQMSPDGNRLLLQDPQGYLISIDRQTGSPTWLGEVESPIGMFGTNGTLLLTRKIGGVKKVVRLNMNREVDVEGFVNALTQ